jgi:hypothetical protein
VRSLTEYKSKFRPGQRWEPLYHRFSVFDALVSVHGTAQSIIHTLKFPNFLPIYIRPDEN